MHWIHLTDEDQLQKIIVRSQEKPQVIFKYSSHCQVSETILQRLHRSCCPEHIDFHFLDLIAYNNISQKLSEIFHVSQQSPQIIVIKDGEPIFEETSPEVSLEEIVEQVSLSV
jgi:bacillithiol system protein YtxJ